VAAAMAIPRIVARTLAILIIGRGGVTPWMFPVGSSQITRRCSSARTVGNNINSLQLKANRGNENEEFKSSKKPKPMFRSINPDDVPRIVETKYSDEVLPFLVDLMLSLHLFIYLLRFPTHMSIL
jgi:hypothetical protein